jgi:hypothetical protein
LHFAIFFIGKIHIRFVFSRGACEAVKTAPLLVVDEAVEAMNKAAGFKYGVATYFMQSIDPARQTVSVIDDPPNTHHRRVNHDDRKRRSRSIRKILLGFKPHA